MSIFGTLQPKFISITNTTVLLEHSKIDEEIMPDIIEHKSVMNGKINRIPLGLHRSYKILVHLLKYTNPNDKLTELLQYKHKEIKAFYPMSDSNPVFLKGSSTIPAKFYISEVQPMYLDSTLYWDAVTIKMKSVNYCHIIPSGIDLEHDGYGGLYATRYGYRL